MKKKFTFLSLFMLLLLGRAMAQSVELTFNEGLTTSYKLKFTVIEGTDECSVKANTIDSFGNSYQGDHQQQRLLCY